MNLYDVLQTVFNFFALLYIHRFMLSFFDFAEKREGRFLPFLYLAYPIITSAVYFYANSPILNLIANVAALFIISLQYRTNLGQRIIALGMTYFCMAILETIVTLSTNYIGVSLFKVGTYQNIVGLIVANLFIFMISHVIYYLKSMRKSIPIPIGLWVSIACVPTLSLLAILVTLHNSRISQLQAMVVVTVFLIINGCVFFLYDAFIASYSSKLQSILLEEEKECYYNQCQHMLQSEHELNVFRHEVQNQLDLIYELLKQDTERNLRKYTEKLEKCLQPENTYSHTNHIALDAILNLKLSQARQKGILVTCNSNIPNDLELDANDLMVILGNLLDNAITASEKCGSDSFIAVQVSYEKGMLFITVKNSYSGNLIKVNGKLQSTKKNKVQHGYGINNVKAVLESYHGMIQFEHTNSVFCTDVAIYCKPNEL